MDERAEVRKAERRQRERVQINEGWRRWTVEVSAESAAPSRMRCFDLTKNEWEILQQQPLQVKHWTEGVCVWRCGINLLEAVFTPHQTVHMHKNMHQFPHSFCENNHWTAEFMVLYSKLRVTGEYHKFMQASLESSNFRRWCLLQQHQASVVETLPAQRQSRKKNVHLLHKQEVLRWKLWNCKNECFGENVVAVGGAVVHEPTDKLLNQC